VVVVGDMMEVLQVAQVDVVGVADMERLEVLQPRWADMLVGVDLVFRLRLHFL
jgi:hypothetical protein